MLGVGCGVWGVGCWVLGVRCGVWGVGEKDASSPPPTTYYLLPTNEKTLEPLMALGFNTHLKIGMTGFEPAASCSQRMRATKLRHIPMLTDYNLNLLKIG